MIYAGSDNILPTSILAPSKLHAGTVAVGNRPCVQLPPDPTACGLTGWHASGSTGGIVAYLHVSWCTHGNEVVHICTESWDALVVKYGAKVKISGDDMLWWIQFHLMHVHSEKMSISAMSVVGIFLCIPSTLPDSRKANPEFMDSSEWSAQRLSHAKITQTTVF